MKLLDHVEEVTVYRAKLIEKCGERISPEVSRKRLIEDTVEKIASNAWLTVNCDPRASRFLAPD